MGLSHISICQTDSACVCAILKQITSLQSYLGDSAHPVKKKKEKKEEAYSKMTSAATLMTIHSRLSKHSSSQSALDKEKSERELQIHKRTTSHVKRLLVHSHNNIKMPRLRCFGETQVENLDFDFFPPSMHRFIFLLLTAQKWFLPT